MGLLDRGGGGVGDGGVWGCASCLQSEFSQCSPNRPAVTWWLDGYNILCLLIWQVTHFSLTITCICVYIHTIYYTTRIVYFIYYLHFNTLTIIFICEKESRDPNSLRNLCHVTMLQLTSLWTRFIHVTVWCRNKSNLCSLDAENVFWSSDLNGSLNLVTKAENKIAGCYQKLWRKSKGRIKQE